MAFIGIQVPEGVREKLAAVDAAGEKVDPASMHITLLYLGKGTSLAQVVKAIAVCASFAQRAKPFAVGCAVRTCFPANPDDGVPVIARVVSPGIAGFREALRAELEKAGVEYSNKYPDYKPHVTLAYSPEPAADQGFEPVVWTVKDFVIWGGDEMDDRVATTCELLG